MTKKDYEIIAQAINHSSRIYGNGYHLDRYFRGWNNATRAAAENISIALKLDNPSFDRKKFLKACGV